MTRPTLASPSSAKEDSVVSFKADCERCVLKKELQHKRATLQMLQGEIERVQQRLNSGASQARMIQRTFIGPIEQHLAMDRVELGQFERAMIRSI
ncbi:hypothetical protein BGZ94_004004 [Podila epigama]|nr:hypothetical protein BGZ94_004004 [Podila epigama]